MANNGGIGPLPFRPSDFLQSSYYAISIAIFLLGLVGFIFSLKWRVDDLQVKEREHPTRSELAQVAIKVEDRLSGLERRMEDLDIHGTRALADRTTLIEQNNHAQDDRIQGLVSRMNELQMSVNQIQNAIPVLTDRQNNNTNAVRELQQRVWGSGGERGPTAPILQPQRPQHPQ